MIENTKKRKRGFISEEDIAIVLQRYSATTVLALLQELSGVADEKFDWNEVVKKTSTGISNPREYQMLWRHLAYNTSLVERLDEEVEPLDDDSDLDYELEAIPTVTPEASAEVVACVKVLAASGMPGQSTLPNGSTVEAPLTTKIPNGQAARVSSESVQPPSFVHGRTNITVPVSVQKQPLPEVTSAEGLDTDGLAGGNLPPRRRRKPWSAAEDLELIAAVKKFGEGNWANILKGEFKSERSASQLSQRWNIIRKRKGNSSLVRSSQLSEAQLAARRAVSLALNMPMTDKLKASFSPGATSLAITHSNSIHRAAEASAVIKSEPKSECGSLPTVKQRSDLSCPDSVPTLAQRSGALGPTAKPDFVTTAAQQSNAVGVSSKSRINLKAQSTKPSPSPDGELVKAAAVAAGARLATPSDAASLLRAAQAKNAVRIMPGGSSMVKASGVASSGNSLPSNVHYIRTGLATTFPTYSTTPPNATRSTSSQHFQGHSMKQAIVQGIQGQTSPKLNAASGTTKAATSSVGNVETNILEDMIPRSVDASKKFSQDDEDSDRGSKLRERGHSHFLGNPQQAQRLEGDGRSEDRDPMSSDPLTAEDLAKSVPVSHQCGTANVSPSSAEVTGNGDCVVSNHMMGFCDKDKYVDMDSCDDHNVGKKTDEPVPMDTCES
ncbi:Homeodomain-like superfamily protein [Heracleum sosnowskyi]|uniref:Homeodomain-like superfamily protein n=1 Tax=Heracleum sosnowskyi TaxID=360622 RepID=A0AAD8J585_9APIA|nr:Homeodomain-like superfamily protein [Heracleum sosnowskyi]